MADRGVRDVLVLTGFDNSSALAMLPELEASGEFRLVRAAGAPEVESGIGPADWSCVLWLIEDFDALPAGHASAVIGQLGPAPVIVLVDTPPADQTAAILAGAEDCIPAGFLQPASLLRIVRHASERALNRVRLLAAERKYAELYDTTPVMMFSLDVRSGCIKSANRFFFEHLGMTPLEVIDRPLSSLLVGDDVDATLNDSVGRLLDGRREQQRPVSIRNGSAAADAAPIEALLSASPVFDADGSVTAANATLIDVTDRNRAARERDALQGELQLSQKLESIGQLAAGIAHEINTPAQYVSDNLSFVRESFDDLMPLLGAMPATVDAIAALPGGKAVADALRAACDTADLDYVCEEIPSALKEGHEGVGKIREIVLALKDFSHPGGEEKEAADLNRIVESTVTVARNEWKYVADVELDLESALPAVPCFPNSLAQVVLNIVVNAAHAIEDDPKRGDTEKGAIRLVSRSVGDASVSLEIHDNGPGIPAAHLRKIFDPFFTTKELGRGTGQGLAISHNVVTEKHGGKLSVESRPGEGSVFRIELPLREIAGDATEVAA